MRKSTTTILPLSAFLLIFLLPAVAPAQTPFYEGKTLTVILSTDPAGTSSVRLRPLIPICANTFPAIQRSWSIIWRAAAVVRGRTMFLEALALTV